MPRFEGVVEKVTLTANDMKKMLSIPMDEINDWSPVRVEILPDKDTLYRIFAESIVERIKSNNEIEKPTKLILPVGPTPQFPILAKISNKESVDWKSVWTFNMDEYIGLPENHR